jgi:hypothetical protein
MVLSLRLILREERRRERSSRKTPKEIMHHMIPSFKMSTTRNLGGRRLKILVGIGINSHRMKRFIGIRSILRCSMRVMHLFTDGTLMDRSTCAIMQ